MIDSLVGQCYIASETAYHMFGGKEAGWTPMQMQWEGSSHWFLRHKDGTILDITANQFHTTPDYSKARGRGFLTKRPSNKTREVLERLLK